MEHKKKKGKRVLLGNLELRDVDGNGFSQRVSRSSNDFAQPNCIRPTCSKFPHTLYPEP